MKIFLITPKQKIEVVPYAYGGDLVSCEIEDTDISFAVDISRLKTEDGKQVTRRMLNKMWED